MRMIRFRYAASWASIITEAAFVLQSLYNLSDEQIEYQVWDRATFTRFVGLGSEDGIPDGTTLWLFREKLARAGLIEKLFDRFDQHLNAKGYLARGGQIVDASIVPVPKQRNTREENEAVKRGETPAEWEQKPARNRQKDKDARWTKKHGKSFFGYKNHVNVDRTHKLIRRYAVTDAAVHDSRKLNGLLPRSRDCRSPDTGNKCSWFCTQMARPKRFELLTPRFVVCRPDTAVGRSAQPGE